MRILHTSDWHIGKRLQGKSRLQEQARALAELSYIVKDGKIDVVLVAGDIFDVSVPPAEAEELFYSAALSIAANSRLVAIAGNHDDPLRLAAPRGIASASNITLVGSLAPSILKNREDFFTTGSRVRDVASGEGWLRLGVEEEVLNLALLPYPSLSRLERLEKMEGDYIDRMGQIIKLCCDGFTAGAVNVFCSHLFVSGSQAIDNELGGALQLPSSLLPKNATYTALGHIHKPQVVSQSRSAHYSGSLLNYSFDDDSLKHYVIIDSDGQKTSIDYLPITAGKRPIRLRAESIAEAMSHLAENKEAYVELTYYGSDPLRPSDLAKLRSEESFTKLIIETPFVKREVVSRQTRTIKELFTDFYRSGYGSAPKPEVVELFIKVIEGEEI